VQKVAHVDRADHTVDGDVDPRIKLRVGVSRGVEILCVILSRHFEQISRGTMGERGVIPGEIGRKRGHKQIRWVMKSAGAMVQRIKLVMLMCPISVTQFLTPFSAAHKILKGRPSGAQYVDLGENSCP